MSKRHASKIKIKNLVLHPLKPKLNILQTLALSHVGMSKMVSLVIITSVVTKLDKWFWHLIAGLHQTYNATFEKKFASYLGIESLTLLTEKLTTYQNCECCA